MYTRVSRIVEEYVLLTDAVEYSIKGRIVEHLDVDPKSRYGWEVSHHYKPSQIAQGVHHPWTVTGATVEEMKGHLMAYLRNFQNINVTLNSRY
jgi:hypothetical protein